MDSPSKDPVSTSNPTVAADKPPIPTLWVDTSMGIKLAKIIRGEKLSDIEVDRGRRLRRIILELVKSGRLLCPMSDQEEEYEAQRLDSEIFAEFSRLSRGARMNHRILVQDCQVYLAMTAFSAGSDTITIPWRIYFHENPIKAVQREKDRRLIVSVTTPPGHPLVEMRREAKAADSADMESVRQKLNSQRKSYAAQLENELRAFGESAIFILRDFYQKCINQRLDFMGYMGALGFIQYFQRWKELGMEPDRFREFMVSDYIKRLPFIRVTAQLRSDLVTGKQAVESGDPGDVRMLSTAIPLSHFVLTDKRMENRIKRLGIDKEWNTAVFSMSTLDGLVKKLESLGQAAA